MVRGVAVAAVAVHTLIAVAHGIAHAELAVELSPAQTAFVVVANGLTPFIALSLLWTRRSQLGWLLLACSMTAALAFGVYWHYIAVSPDHIDHLPDGGHQGMFRLTALLLAVAETFGVTVGLWGLARGTALPRITIYRHPDCARCAKIARVHRSLDWLGRLRFSTGLPKCGPLRLGEIAVEDTRTEEIAKGVEAVRRIYRQVPAYLPLLPLLWIPPIARWVDRDVRGCEEGCTVPGATSTSAGEAEPLS